MKNWKTTAIGILAGTLTILQTTIASYQAGTKVQWLQVALGIVIMAFGLVMKDFNVTGVGAAATTAKTADAADKKSATIASLVLLALMLSGCTMSLESARTKGTVIKTGQVNLPAYMTANRTECQNLDSIQRYWGYGAITTGPIAPLAAGVAAIPGIGDGGKNAMLITAGVAGAITVFELAEQNNFANQWAQQCAQAVGP